MLDRSLKQPLIEKAASKMMGHSEIIHSQTYSGWFDDFIHEQDEQAMLKKQKPRQH